MINIRLPRITAATERDQLIQMKSYLHQLVQELNWALSSIESGSNTEVTNKKGASKPVTKEELTNTFNELKSLIVKSSRTVSAYSEAAEERNNLMAEDMIVGDTGWISLGLSSETTEPALNTGRNGNGCFYRVVNGRHVYVAFNAGFKYVGSPVTISANNIPAEFRPLRNTYGLNVTNGRGAARSFVNSSGAVRIDYVQNMAAAETTNEITVNWIDGYIDYWV